MERLNQRFASEESFSDIKSQIILMAIDNIFNFLIMTLNHEVEASLTIIRAFFVHLEFQTVNVESVVKIFTHVSLSLEMT
jgi:hypothetical protein